MPNSGQYINPPKQGYRFGQYPSNLSYIFSNQSITSDDGLIFSIFDGDSSYSNLSETLNVNSLDGTLIASYLGHNANQTQWTGTGGTLVLSGSSTNPTTNSLAPFTDLSNKSVQFNFGKAFQNTDVASADIGTEDFAIEIVFKAATTTLTLAAKKTSATIVGNAGWAVHQNSTTQLRFYLSDGVNDANISRSVLTPGSWYHAIIFVDRSEASGFGSNSYVNAAGSTGINFSTVSGSATTNALMTIGANSALTSPWNGNVAYFRMWKRDNWFVGGISNHIQWQAIAKERFAKLTGMYASKALGNPVPATMLRSTDANFEIASGSNDIKTLFTVGDNWMRYTRRKELSGGQYLTGFLSETAATNLLTQSQTLDVATAWIPSRYTASANVLVAPDLTITADGFIANTQNENHFISQATTVTANIQTFSIFAKKGASNFVGLFTTAVNNGIMFNLLSGTIGNRFAAPNQITGNIEAYGNDWYRCVITYTSPAGYFENQIYSSRADWEGNSGTQAAFIGDNITIDTYLWGAQLESGIGVPSSYVATTTAAATRAIDNLSYSGSLNAPASGPGSIRATFLKPDQNEAVNPYVFSISNANSSNNRRALTLDASGDRVIFIVSSGSTLQANFAVNGDIIDGEIHTLHGTWDTNSFNIYVDNTLSGSDTSGSNPVPISTDTIYVGQAFNNTVQLNGLVSNAKIWNKVVGPEV